MDTPSTDMYVTLTYEQYKAFEKQCKAFDETVHGEGTEWYHKSMRIRVGHITFEIHGPNVKARQTEQTEGVAKAFNFMERNNRLPEAPDDRHRY